MQLSSYKVLVVDDDESMTNLIVSLLSQQGHQCTKAVDGAEALDKASRAKFNAVITDIVIPKIDGIALVRELIKRDHNLPVMVMTGYTDEYSARDAVAAGAREFITKPFSIVEFVTRFQRMMRDHETLCQIEAKKNEIIFDMHKESIETVKELEMEIEKLKNRLNTLYVDFF